MADTYDPLFSLAVASEELRTRYKIKDISVEVLKARILRGDIAITYQLLNGKRKTITNRAEIPSLDRLSPAMGILESELERFALSLKSKRKKEGLSRIELTSLYEVVTIMAVAGYGYDPRAARNAATQQILDDGERLGIKIDAGTVLKWLRIAADEVQFTPPKKT